MTEIYQSINLNETHKILRDLEIQTYPTRRSDQMLISKKKKYYNRVDFAVLKEQKVKMKESKKISKYLGLARELKILWNMKII